MKYTTQNLIEGRKGETIAVQYLKGLGYNILFRNYKNFIGEIDIIARDAERLVFVEVKTRATGQKGLGRDAINSAKISKIRQTASLFLKANKMLDALIRFDVIEVTDTNIEHLKAVF